MNHSDIKRQQDESIKNYKIRLCENKDYFELSWNDVAELINTETGEKHSPDVFRKFWRYFKEGYDYAVETKVTDNDVLKEIQDKTIDFQKSKFQFQDQKRELTNIVRQQARFEHLKEEIHKSILELKEHKPLQFKSNNNNSPTLSKQALVLLGDWHFGSDFSNSLNTYNPTVFKQRVEKLVQKVIEYGKRNEISVLKVAILGDMISGLIHVSTRVQSSEDVIKQIQIVSEVLSEVIAKFSNHFDEVKVTNVIGNHSRTVANKTESILKENFENLIPWYLESRLKDFLNVSITNNADGYVIDDVDGEKFIYVHGDLDYVSNTAKTLPQMLGFVPKYIFAGHIHHNTVKEHGRTTVITNGSLCGIDDYAISKRFFAEPMQKFMVLDGSDIECMYDIKL